MNSQKEKIEKDIILRQYLDLINRISKAEYRSMGVQHLIEYGELVNIGIQTVDILIGNEKMDRYNESYIATAVKWAIRNELRRRYRWHGVKSENIIKADDSDKAEIREAIYKTILSTEEMIESDNPFEVKDIRKTPEENVEFLHMSEAIRNAITKLPRRERELIEAKFFKEKKLHELADEFSISPSRISRIIRSGLDKIKEELKKSDIF